LQKTKVSAGSKGRKLRVAVIGATGYTGMELVRLLLHHPAVTLTTITSEHYAGKRLSEVHPSFQGRCDLLLEEVRLEALVSGFDLAFTALPHGISMEVVSALVASGKRVVDLSADFRLSDAQVYEKWYRPHQAPQLLSESVYGLPEVHRRKISQARLVASPGCYPTGAVLGVAPLLKKGLLRGPIIIDAKSGVTGAGRSAALELSFSEVNDNFKAYGVGKHRHTPEIEQELGRIAKKPVAVIFTPHLVPMNRGILSTIYVQLQKILGEEDIVEIYRDFYRDEPFVRVALAGGLPETKEVRGTNDCSIGVRVLSGSRHVVIITAIDNLVKGAAGQAVQAMNLMCGFPEVAGLKGPALVP
jgi:N-acetyl-gamma-glutamyl-phosphate reductase